jgi:RNA polymerase sigma-70 factor (ECF subfamily)
MLPKPVSQGLDGLRQGRARGSRLPAGQTPRDSLGRMADAGVPRRTAVDDAGLVEGLKRRDPDAYEAMVRTYSPRLLALARRMLGNEEDARDALQDAMVSAYKAIDRFEGQAQLSTWLHRIVVNTVLMKLRTRRRKPEEPLDPLLPAFLSDGHHASVIGAWREPVDQLAERAEIRSLVRDAILSLPEGSRDVLMLRDIEEMSTSETASTLGISTNAVKTRLHRARLALRTKLDELFQRGEA